MPPRRKIVPIVSLLTLTLGLLLASALAWACGPAAPAVQEGGPEATATPTPTPGVTIEPMLRSIAAVGSQNNAQGAGGAAERTDRTVKLDVRVDSSETMDYEGAYMAVRDFILSSGGSAASGVGEYQVPIAIVSELLQRPEVISILVIDEGDFPYPKMDRGLNNVVSALQSGAGDDDAVVYACIRHGSKAYLILEAEDNQSLGDVKAWLASNEVYINPQAYSPADPAGTTDRNFPTPYLTVLVPVSLIQPLSELPGVVSLEGGDCWPWDVAEPSPELLAYFELFTNDLLPPDLRPTPAAAPQPSAETGPDAGGQSGSGDGATHICAW